MKSSFALEAAACAVVLTIVLLGIGVSTRAASGLWFAGLLIAAGGHIVFLAAKTPAK